MPDHPQTPDLQARLAATLAPDFEILHPLPAGGMSVVFLASQPSLNRQVVIKVLPRELAGGEATERFRREIGFVAALQHPQIVPLIAAGEVDGLPWFIMPFSAGESLRTRLQRGPVSLRECVTILSDVARALAHAHGLGVVHRDIKPDNILLPGGEASAVVTDFGVARAVAVTRRRTLPDAFRPDALTSEGTSLGTPAYMAPEQAAGDPATDHRADLYALGIVAYEMLAGAPPFLGGKPQEVLAAQLTAAPPPLGRRRADVPPRLEALIRWCLEKDPAARPGSAVAVLAALSDPELLTARRALPRAAMADSAPAGTRAPGLLDSVSRLIEAVHQDLRHAGRSLRLHPGFTATVVITLALGIGVNATMFGILDRLLLRAPAHITDPERVVQVYTRRLGSTNQQVTQPYAVATDFQRNVPAFEEVAATTIAFGEPNYYPLGRGIDAGRVIGAQVSPGYFPLLGVQPWRGHFFRDDEAGEANPQKLVVLSYGFWQRHFGGTDAAIGQSLDLGTDRYTVVGVAPEGFTGVDLLDVDVWIPIAAADGLRFLKGPEWRTTRSSQWMVIVARLRRGVTVAEAESQATAAFRAAEKADATTDPARQQADSTSVFLSSIVPGRSARPFGPGAGSGEVRVARLLGGVSLAVLLIACANVANLLLVRGLGRRREIAVRLALGVSRRRLLGQLLMEGVLLALLGGVGALVGVALGSGLIRGLLLGEAAWTGQTINPRILVFTLIAALATGVLTSLFPALRASRADLTADLKAGIRSGPVSRSGTRTALLVGQAALAVVLLVGSGLFVRTLRRVAGMELGIDLDRILMVEMKHGSVGMSTAEAREAFRTFTERAREVPGITSAATAIAHTFGLAWGTSLRLPGREPPAETVRPTQYLVTPDYFEVMGVRLLAGRLFTGNDRVGSELVTVINQTAARTYWPGENPIGQCVRLGGDTMPCTTVVGIVSNARRQSLIEDPVTQVYRPLDQVPPAEYDRTVTIFGFSLLARTSDDPARLAEPLRRALQRSYPGIPYVTVRPLADRLNRQTRSWTLGATMFTLFGSLALLIAVVGLYSVVRFSIAERHHEFGVRVALGASGSHLIRSAVLRGVLPAAAGIGLGLLIAGLAGTLLQGLLLDVSPRDPLTFATAGLGLLAASGLACLVPALRLSRVDPMVVLREE